MKVAILRIQEIQTELILGKLQQPLSPLNNNILMIIFSLGMSLEDDRSIADSLEKYRPHNYEFGNRNHVESSDINDIRDFYVNVGTRNRALNR